LEAEYIKKNGILIKDAIKKEVIMKSVIKDKLLVLTVLSDCQMRSVPEIIDDSLGELMFLGICDVLNDMVDEGLICRRKLLYDVYTINI